MLPANAMATKDEDGRLLTRKVHLGCGRDGVADLLADRRELASRFERFERRKRRVRRDERSKGKECGGRKSLTHGGERYEDLEGR